MAWNLALDITFSIVFFLSPRRQQNFSHFPSKHRSVILSHLLFCNDFPIKIINFLSSQPVFLHWQASLIARKESSIQIYIKMNFKAIQSINFWQDFTYYEEEKKGICLSKWWNGAHVCQEHYVHCWNVLLTLNTICFVK